MEITSHLKYLRISPRKTRLVASTITGMSVRRARLILDHLPKRASLPLTKLLSSAVSDAKHNFQIEEETLAVKKILVNEGAKLKRSRPRAFGRSSPIRRRTSHVSLVLESETGVPLPVRKYSGPERTIRDAAAAADFQPESGDKKSSARESERAHEYVQPGAKRSKGFIGRMFRRKAI
ncbi:MAG: 50S ribosomal protein L22 [Candidatus Sungbacteria bacterium]|nr:50S ribosomal protein L22 [Candidatus Sungbacteria bacterium]